MISVVVPTRSSSGDLKDCLKSLKNQTKKAGEIIVVFDSKVDRNVKLAKSYKARAVFDPNHTIGGAYSVGARVAKGEFVAFIDDDATAPRDWLTKLAKEFACEDIDVIGGEDILPPDSSFFQSAAYQIDKARRFKSPIYGKHACKRFRTANIAYRKTVFAQDNFDPKLIGLQEPEFHYRLFKKSFRMKFNPEIYVYHKRRDSLRGIFWQIYRNGKAKTELIKLHRELLGFADAAPFIALAYLLLLLLAAPAKTTLLYFFAPLLFYFLAKPARTLLRTKQFRYYPALFTIILTRELAYGLGILAGAGNLFTAVFRKA